MYAAACESLLEELLQHNLWEQNLRPEEAREKFVTRNGYPKAISYLVNNELGNFYTSTGWRDNPPAAIVAWSRYIARLRNKAVHEGYSPTIEEMKKCVETVNKLVTFLADEVFRTRLERPFTALALLGQEGLEARGGWDDSFSRIEVRLRDMNVRLKTFRRWADALSGLRSRERLTTPIARDATCMLVFKPSGDRSFYLVEDQGVHTQRISRDDVVFQPAVEHKVRVLEQSQAPSILSVFTLPFDSVEVENPTWELYSYDVIPGFEVFLFREFLTNSLSIPPAN